MFFVLPKFDRGVVSDNGNESFAALASNIEALIVSGSNRSEMVVYLNSDIGLSFWRLFLFRDLLDNR